MLYFVACSCIDQVTKGVLLVCKRGLVVHGCVLGGRRLRGRGGCIRNGSTTSQCPGSPSRAPASTALSKRRKLRATNCPSLPPSPTLVGRGGGGRGGGRYTRGTSPAAEPLAHLLSSSAMYEGGCEPPRMACSCTAALSADDLAVEGPALPPAGSSPTSPSTSLPPPAKKSVTAPSTLPPASCSSRAACCRDLPGPSTARSLSSAPSPSIGRGLAGPQPQPGGCNRRRSLVGWPSAHPYSSRRMLAAPAPHGGTQALVRLGCCSCCCCWWVNCRRCR